MVNKIKRFLFLAYIFWSASFLIFAQEKTVFIEAESFENKGGWVIDQQFMDVMGSPFLMAHGLGNPDLPKIQTYNLGGTLLN